MVAIIDYDAGNIKSVEKAIQFLGEEAVMTRDENVIMNADRVILPGVGAFGDAMENIRKYDLERVIKAYVETGKPFLGICLGLQLLFKESEESVGIKGLDLIPGAIVKIPDGEGLKIPQIGWNSITVNPESRLFKGINDGSYVYFVHSFYLKCENESDVAAKTYYGTEIHAAVERGNLFACQFHPEKSGEVGLKILKNFINL
ncbi:MAG: imidazole glycerol phosphate synthase subunit HisH [Eubacterium sp.]|nr:imidazole glycerol phosphate synthase subunit HisH [Eubacterium sp.]